MSTIVLDIHKKLEEIKKPWNMGFNTCHAALLLRDDLFEHMKMSKEVGFKYIRFHNIFSSQVGIYNEDEQGRAIYKFDNMDIIFDRILEAGLLPFFEISFCPELLKSANTTITKYKANTSIPISYEKWNNLIKATIYHLVERYGIHCMEKWYFEVWNEPDLAFFNGEMEDYFTLYDHTVLAVKNISEKLKVGGPATSKCKWIDEFIKHIENGSIITEYKRVPCDFISTHAYPSDVAFLDGYEGNVKLQNSNIMYELFSGVKEKIDKTTLKGIPLIMGEWNSSAGPKAFNHDEKNNGAFIIKTLNELKDVIQGSLYWNLSDIYEEWGFQHIPFHGGYGMLSVNSIPKSSFNAFTLLNQMKGQELNINIGEDKDGKGCIATYDFDNRIINILLYYYMEPDTENLSGWNMDIELINLLSETVAYKSHEINDSTGSAYEWWLKMGAPQYPTLSNLDFLMRKSKMEENRKILFKGMSSNLYKFAEVLMPGDVKLIQICW